MIAASVFAGVALTRFRRSPTAIMMGALSVALAARGLGAHRRDDTRAALAGPRGSHLREAVTINQGPSVVYAYWRDLTNLSRFMAHVDRVDVLSDTTSRWVVRGPLGPVEWNAEIINDIPGELIAWRTQRGAGVASAGSVRFKDAPGGRGTEVTVTLQVLSARRTTWCVADCPPGPRSGRPREGRPAPAEAGGRGEPIRIGTGREEPAVRVSAGAPYGVPAVPTPVCVSAGASNCARRTHARSISATLQACAMHPRAWYGISASKISLTVPTQASPR